MPTSLRKSIISVGLLCLIVGSVLIWRATHPPLSDEQQILQNLTAVQDAAQNRQTKNVAAYLSKEFTWSAMSRQEFVRTMSGAFFSARDVQITLSNVDVTQSGPENAITSGDYNVAMRQSQGAPLSNAHGPFKLYWRRDNGEWKVYKAEGGTNIGQ